MGNKKIEIKENYFIDSSEGGLFEDIMNNIILKTTPEKMKFILINNDVPKYNQYANSEYAYIPIITGDIDKVYGTLNDLLQEMLNRYDKFNEIGVKTIDEFNKNSKFKLPKLLIFIDEIEEIFKNKNYKKTENDFCKLLSRGMNVGIQFIIETKYDIDTRKYGDMMFFLQRRKEWMFKRGILLICEKTEINMKRKNKKDKQ